MLKKMLCPRCGSDKVKYRNIEFLSGKGKHIKAICVKCRRYIKFMSQKTITDYCDELDNTYKQMFLDL